MQAGAKDRDERIDPRREQPLELVALGELKVGQAVDRRVFLVELGCERPQPCR